MDRARLTSPHITVPTLLGMLVVVIELARNGG